MPKTLPYVYQHRKILVVCLHCIGSEATGLLQFSIQYTSSSSQMESQATAT